ncbi:unnamed protein product [Rhizoctonia solani]|uniref:Uncharacterized protein n=1 Tax=Rhizoctonia solani TaxID=456999 RepID=A0A8H3E929_9AGAM|nr:unnamed protein product [Rhizoctonia solani]
MILPLAIHFIGTLVVAAALLYYLNGRQFYLERQPRVRLADGTYRSQQLGRYSLLQPEVTTLLSVWLMILRWVAAMWAVPLCWRTIFVLAGRHGVQYRDISWATNYGILYPSTHFRRILNMLLGLVLILTLAPQPPAPLLTGSISWLPSNRTVDLTDRPDLTIAGYPQTPNFSPDANFSASERANIATTVVKYFNTAWSQAAEESTFKRVVPAIARLSAGSTIDSILLPYFAVTGVEWLPIFDDHGQQRLRDALGIDGKAGGQLRNRILESGAAVLLSAPWEPEDTPTARSQLILINIGTDTLPAGTANSDCNSKTTILPTNSTIPALNLDVGNSIGGTSTTNCFAYAKISFDAGHGFCSNCRISSYSTVQNDTELQRMPYYRVIELTLSDMPDFSSLMTPMRDNLPDPTSSLEVYITALLTRLYSALWNSWTDASPEEFRLTTGYKPLVPTLRAEVNHARVYAWLGLQLLFTLAGVLFIGLQSRSRYPLVGNVDMLAFDIDSTEVTKPNAAIKGETPELLRIEPKGDRWKVVVAK